MTGADSSGAAKESIPNGDVPGDVSRETWTTPDVDTPIGAEAAPDTLSLHDGQPEGRVERSLPA